MTKILVIDDDMVLAKMYKHIFDVEKIFQTYLAFDGIDGIEKSQGLLPHIILLDVMLPKLNGYDVLEKLKSNPLTKSIPVIMMSNIDELPQEKEKIIALGVAKFINKSAYDPRQITSLVKEILNIKTEYNG